MSLVKLFFTFLVLNIAFFSICQEVEGDSSKYISRKHPGIMWFYTGLRPNNGEPVRKYDRLIVDVHHNSSIPFSQLQKQHWSSIGVSTNLMFDISLNDRNTVAFGWGLNHSFFKIRHHGHFSKNFKLKQSTYVEQENILEKPLYSLRGHSFSIPLEFRFRSKGWQHFKWHIGTKVGVQASVYSQVVSGEFFKRKIVKSFNFPDVQRLQCAVYTRVGFRNVSLYGAYSLMPLFSNKNSTSIHLLQVGLSLSLF